MLAYVSYLSKSPLLENDIHFRRQIDASCMGNEARFVNDYRGIKAKPNAMFKDSTLSSQGELGMAVWSGCQAISRGEEILVSYGKSWWNARH